MIVKIEDRFSGAKFKNEREKGLTNIYYTSNWLQNKAQAILKKFGLTSQQSNILSILVRAYPEPLTSNQIKECMFDFSPDVTRLIERLKAKKLIHRKTDPLNRRKLSISLSEQGLKVIDQMRKMSSEFELHTSTLSEKEYKTLNTLLDKLRQGE